MQPLSRFTIGILLSTLLFLSPIYAATEVNIEPKSQSRLHLLAKMVNQQGELERYDFAWIAVSEVAFAYDTALQASSSEKPTKTARQIKLHRWRKGTSTFTQELQQQISNLNHAQRISIQANGAGPVIVFIDSEAVVISGPEVNSARFLEQRIIDAYCALHSCESLQRKDKPESEPPPVAVEQGNWQISRYGKYRYQTPDALEFYFSNLQLRQQKQAWCETVAEELRLISRELKKAMRAGYPVEWSELKLQPLNTAPPRAHLLLNQQQEYLALPIMLLAHTSLLEQGGQQWIRHQVEGSEQKLPTLFRADQVFSKTISLLQPD